MKAIRWLFCGIGCLTLALTSCSGSKAPPTTATAPPAPPRVETNPRVLILGRWVSAQPGRESETIEFAKDGTMKGGGKYTFLDDATIEYQEPKLLSQQKTKAKVKVSKDELILDIVDSKSRPDDGAEWSPSPDDLERKGKQEKFRRAP